MFEHFSTPQIEISTPPDRKFSQKCEQSSYRRFWVLKMRKIQEMVVQDQGSGGGDTSCREAQGTLGPNILIDI